MINSQGDAIGISLLEKDSAFYVIDERKFRLGIEAGASVYALFHRFIGLFHGGEFDRLPLLATTPNSVSEGFARSGWDFYCKKIFKKNVWNGQVGDIKEKKESDLKAICTRSGGDLVVILKYMYAAKIRTLITRIESLVHALENSK